jgi:hypothetical protein
MEGKETGEEHSTHEKDEKCFQKFRPKPEGMRPLWRQKNRCEKETKIYLEGIESKGRTRFIQCETETSHGPL